LSQKIIIYHEFFVGSQGFSCYFVDVVSGGED